MTHILSAVAWPYANGPRHIGHVAGFGIPSDVFSRYMRMKGHEVLMVSGTDEHGTPILVEAEKEGLTPRQLADKNNRLIVEDLVQLGLSYDLFTRTTTGNHYQTVRAMFEVVRDNGYMLVQTTRAAISPSTGRTLPDRYIEGTCPICGAEGARGDQCDACGNQLDPTDLVKPRSKINGETPKFVETEHYFLDLPALAEALTKWLDEREATGTWRPNVIKFSKNFLKEIKPRAMTRDIDWGIPIPGWEDQPKRLYVWFDAVVGYLSASIEWARRSGDPEAWRKWWNSPEALSYYFMGKDNIVFHSQIWPAELLGYNGEGSRGGDPGNLGHLNLPTEVVSSEFLTMEGKKFATSKGIVIYVRDMLERYQVDALRYFISAAGPENQDADFTWAEFVRRTNGELVAAWGNLVNRTAAMISKRFGEIPPAGKLEGIDQELLDMVATGFDTVGGLIEAHHQKAALGEVMRLVGEANRYVAQTEPFKLKDESQRNRLGTILHVLAQVVTDLNCMMSPFLPTSCNTIDRVLGGEGNIAPMPRIEEVVDLDVSNDDGSPRTYPIITGDYTDTPTWERHPVTVGQKVAKPVPVFEKLDESVVDEEIVRYADLLGK
ncbi:methionine--tRNA ligase [Mobiluncus mulieris 28-1]|uniref:methionine--tRNA ligase n=1 Tax=Mobiluncus mulieris TaxID=2052 RepID=UPI00019F8765|nr:methionine--tRNA ligase [Mobiluncus mulieris]EEJ53304.1 methionine--tRNA ligase [Mobiluncus mulieris ATCC 35243]EEZ92217.1 methionine--tRNA ligase [Mobiluncus mulieris 28-1]MCU9971929.1 methionine--tRNA ligase [Mobiluncus mulieris]MCV0003209.1 methionine--tRNA ligase [Mobiluncus mulieris]NMW63590.1 methionine--tRNA ligase [Mobiluncus mulieris]